MDIVKNELGYYEVTPKPTDLELSNYYAEKYYQQNKGNYQKVYSDEELLYFHNKNSEKFFVIQKEWGQQKKAGSLLDIGCGEGWTLKFFKQKGWDITGIDYSSFGCAQNNPECVSSLILGNIYDSIIELSRQNKKYDIVWLDNVLEHVIDPLELLKNCAEFLTESGILVVDVPNDFSVLQNYLLEKLYVQRKYWVALPDHLSYFSKESLSKLADLSGLNCFFTMSDNPIDFNLLNPDSNYVEDSSKGKNCHKSRVTIDNLMHAVSVESAVNYYKSLADLGMGRQIISFFKKK